MSKVTSEAAFEDSIEQQLLASGWLKGDPSGYDRGLGLNPSELVAFLQASQPDEWEQLTQRLGGAANATDRVAKYVADLLTQRGTVDGLRGVTKMNGVTFRLAFFAPANGLTSRLWQRYEANRLSVVRQLHHSESKPADSLDVTLFVNGIPTATAELKNPLTQQSVGHATRQYQRDRNPSDLIFRADGCSLRRRPEPGLYDHPAGGRADAVLAVQPGFRRRGPEGRRRQSGQPRRLRHRVLVGAGLAARRVAGPAWRVRARRGRV